MRATTLGSVLLSLTACGVKAPSSSSDAPAVINMTSANVSQVLAGPWETGSAATVVTNLRATHLTDVIAEMEASVETAPVMIDGVVIEFRSADQESALASLRTLAATYDTLGALWDKTGYQPSKPTEANIQASVEAIAAYQHGNSGLGLVDNKACPVNAGANVFQQFGGGATYRYCSVGYDSQSGQGWGHAKGSSTGGSCVWGSNNPGPGYADSGLLSTGTNVAVGCQFTANAAKPLTCNSDSLIAGATDSTQTFGATHTAGQWGSNVITSNGNRATVSCQWAN